MQTWCPFLSLSIWHKCRKQRANKLWQRRGGGKGKRHSSPILKQALMAAVVVPTSFLGPLFPHSPIRCANPGLSNKSPFLSVVPTSFTHIKSRVWKITFCKLKVNTILWDANRIWILNYCFLSIQTKSPLVVLLNTLEWSNLNFAFF